MAVGPCMYQGMLHPLQYDQLLDLLCLIDMLEKLMKYTGTLHQLQYVSKLSTECYNLPTMFRLFRVQKFSSLRLVKDICMAI